MTALQAAPRAASHAGALLLVRQGLAYGALFGVALAGFESLAAMPAMSPLVEGVLFMAKLVAMWGVCGVIMAWTAQAVGGRLRARWVALIFLVEALLLAYAWGNVLGARQFSERLLGFSVSPSTSTAYNLWILLVYGGAFFGFCLIGRRMARARDVLARAEIERSRTTALLHEAQFEAIKGRVDPALLLRAISVVRERYRSRREGAEALLDAFVAFLRQAMPAVRSGRSSILAELALLRAYVQLLHQLEGGRVLCRIAADEPPRDLRFPALLLLPLVGRVSAAQATAIEPVRVELTWDGDSMKLVIAGHTERSDWMGDELTRRLQHAMRAEYGERGRWMAGGSPSLTLWLPLTLAPAAQEEPVDERR
jgi:hypothetical protein